VRFTCCSNLTLEHQMEMMPRQRRQSQKTGRLSQMMEAPDLGEITDEQGWLDGQLDITRPGDPLCTRSCHGWTICARHSPQCHKACGPAVCGATTRAGTRCMQDESQFQDDRLATEYADDLFVCVSARRDGRVLRIDDIFSSCHT
jgi:hypothetical protein